MREHLYRGKRVDNGEWVEGCLVYDAQHTCIRDFCYEYHEVLPETVGEYTGFTDKNERKIFEKSIVEFDGDHKRDVIIWGNGEYNGVSGFRLKRHPLFSITSSNHNLFEVIGNIHDNPELLEGK